MIKGAVFTIGIFLAIGGLGFAALSVFAAGMSDVPNAQSDAGFPTAIGLAGVAMIVGAFFIHA